MIEDFVVRVDVEALVGAAHHEIGGADVELPDIFGLPRRERFGIHGLDIGVGEQAEHLQLLGRAHLFGGLADRAGIEDVAAQEIADFQMALDQEEDRLAVGRIEVEARQACFCEFEARGHVMVDVGALARVVEQDGEIEQVGLLDLIEELGVALIPLRLRLSQGVEIFDRDEGVLVDGEAVRIIADHERIDAP